MATRIQRDTSKEALFTVMAIGCGIAAIYTFMWSGWHHMDFLGTALKWTCAIIIGFIALGIYYAGRAGSGHAACPACGGMVEEIHVSDNIAVLCLCCSKYVGGTNGTLDVIPEDHVATRPVFGAYLPSELRFPSQCCMCDAPATRVLEAKLVEKQDASFGKDLAVGVASLGTLKLVEKTTYRVNVPHCETHSHGAILTHAKDQHDVMIAFRSYPYQREFIRLNQTAPRQMFWP